MNQPESFLIDIIDIGDIDMSRVTKQCKQIIEDFKQNSTGQDLTSPYSITLTSNDFRDNPEEPVLYSKVHNTGYFDRPHQAHLLQIYESTPLAMLASKLPFAYSIIRLSVLPPNTIIGMHTDESCHAQLAIYTNQDAFVAARSGETVHVPVDGRLYIISTTTPHTAFNAAQEERVHLSVSIFDDEYVRILKNAQEMQEKQQ